MDSGPGNLAPPPSGFPDWDPSTHAAYTDSPCPYSAAEGFLTSDFYPPSDPGRSGPFPLGMEVNYKRGQMLKGRLKKPQLCQAWRCRPVIPATWEAEAGRRQDLPGLQNGFKVALGTLVRPRL